MELPEALHLIAAAGIPTAPFAVAGDPDDAVMLARSLGYPAVLKAVGGDINHKTERGGVALGLETDEQVRRTAEEMMESLGLTRLLVMRRIKGGTEIIVGGKQDRAFGPLVLLGLGGVTAEALRDVSLKLAPVEDWEAGRMLDGLRGAALLKGFRGAPPANRAAILQVVMQASILISRLPQIKELDINPLLAGPNGIAAVDARVRVGRAD